MVLVIALEKMHSFAIHPMHNSLRSLDSALDLAGESGAILQCPVPAPAPLLLQSWPLSLPQPAVRATAESLLCRCVRMCLYILLAAARSEGNS